MATDLTPMHFDSDRCRHLRDDGLYLKPGWYAVDDGGRPHLGRFLSPEACIKAISLEQEG